MRKWPAILAQATSSVQNFTQRNLLTLVDFSRRQRREILVALVLAIACALIVDRAFKYWEKSNETRALGHIRDAEAAIIAYGKDDQPESLGCGIFVQPNGTLVTHYQVVKTPRVEARLIATGAYYKLSDIIREDGVSGITVLQFDGRGIPYVNLGDSDRVESGERVLASIAQAGLDCSIVEGLVNQPKAKLGANSLDFIQFSASGASGGNGGGLFNSQGEVVGIISSSGIPLELQRSASMVFAIPINRIRAAIQGLGAGLTEGSPEYFYSMGVLAENKRDFDKAIKYFQKAISLNGKYADAYLELGGIYYEQGAYAQELSAYEKAFEYAPTSVDISYYLATSYEDMKMYDEAIAQYNTTLRIKPDHKDSLYQLAILYITRGERAKAAELAGRLGGLDPGLARELELLLSRTR